MLRLKLHIHVLHQSHLSLILNHNNNSKMNKKNLILLNSLMQQASNSTSEFKINVAIGQLLAIGRDSVLLRLVD
jgi:hypothetical protein